MAALADGNDSFAARFLYAWPDPPPYCRLVERRRAYKSGKPHLIEVEIEGKR